MFVGREEELRLLGEEITSSGKRTILVYGKRRVGKTTLVKKASEGFKGKVIFYEALAAKKEVNINAFSLAIGNTYEEPAMPFTSFGQAFAYLGQKNEETLVLIDEYADLGVLERQETIDSEFRQISDNLSDNIKLVISGSQMDMMKSLMEENNPLFGRFDLILRLEEFDYLTASRLYNGHFSERRAIDLYAVFSGMPYIASLLDMDLSLEENIEELLIPSTGKVRLYIEYVLKQELQKVQFGTTILSILGNAKMRYSEIEAALGGDTSGRLAQQLERLIELELIEKSVPVNKPRDRKKGFYSISNNLVRFYYAYLARFNGRQNLISASSYYQHLISPSIGTFLSYRFEDIARQFFIHQARAGLRTDIIDIGSYWYDDKKNKRNGEFDCVLRTESGYEIYEVKHLSLPMTEGQCREEARRISGISEFPVPRIGFVSFSGFDFTFSEWSLISGEMLFRL